MQKGELMSEEQKEKIRNKLKGKKHTEERKMHMKENQPNKFGENNGMWKGNSVGYNALHRWIYGQKGRPDICEHCGYTSEEKRICWANKDHLYKRNLDDWVSLCYSCHRIYDKTINSSFAIRSSKHL